MKKQIRIFSFILLIVFVFGSITTVNAESIVDEYIDVELKLNDEGNYEGEIELYLTDPLQRDMHGLASANVGSVKFYMDKLDSEIYDLSLYFSLSNRYQAMAFNGTIQVRDGAINTDILHEDDYSYTFRNMLSSGTFHVDTISLPDRLHYQVRIKSGGFVVHTGEFAVAGNGWYNVWPK
ncbi:hypothetical protein [Tissierella praeacuta]|uniref:hypothetical protein n=1 Tax=Tissierella praeacuta TaxID=43131 RepID=UPI0033420C9F